MSKASPVTWDTRIWIEMLDRLEADLVEAEAAAGGELAGPVSSWADPDAMPNLPESLVDRVHDLVTRQASLMERLDARRLTVRQQIRYLNVDAAKGIGEGPRFIDQSA